MQSEVIIEKKTRDGRDLRIAVEWRGDAEDYYPYPTAVAYIDGKEVGSGNCRRGKTDIPGMTHVVGGKVALPQEEGERLSEALMVAKAAWATARFERIERNVPGLEVLRASYAEHEEYERAFERTMDGDNDGAWSPALPESNPDALRVQYPRAALYLRAEGYECSSNYRKSSAGRRVKKLLENGGGEAEARELLENWLPAEVIWG